MTIKISKLTHQEIPGLLGFMEQSLKTWPIFNELWHWREQGMPESGGEEAIVAKAEDSVVGCIGVVPLMVTVKGQPVRACWQQDSLVSSAMRGRGLGKKLVAEAEKGYHLVMAKGTSPAMYRLRKSVGFLDVDNADYLVRVLKPAAISNPFKKYLIECGLWVYGALVPFPRGRDNLQVASIRHFDREFDDLAKKRSAENVIIPFKSADFLNWRYFRCPIKTYTVFKAYDAGLRGAIVLNIPQKDASGDGWIVDLICAPDDAACAYGLLRRALAFFKEHHVQRVFTFATLPAARRWFFRIGFLPTGKTPRFTYRYLEEGHSGLALEGLNWNFWHGDGDVELYS
ncbi:MAG: hypothetical protein VR64_23450 [Desulfatitalea sp. BRH_c12]|nr:MAG: hypothetical protein VR64_23450 [Desulfatitalea sp. BRH_c12]